VILRLFCFLLLAYSACGQTGVVRGTVRSGGKPVEFAHVGIEGTPIGASADEAGRFVLRSVPVGRQTLQATAVGFGTAVRTVHVQEAREVHVDFELNEDNAELKE
jgi:outer membrane receptor for ferrienterochelin and colicins